MAPTEPHPTISPPTASGGHRAARGRGPSRAIQRLVRTLFPGSRAVAVVPLATDDSSGSDDSHKGAGYGAPRRIHLRDAAGGERDVVLRTVSANDFGHDRRSDRAQQILLSYDTFGLIPDHVQALDVGVFRDDGQGARSLTSIAGAGEFYLVTSWARGVPYADDLRRIAHDRALGEHDLKRAEALARYLAALHTRRGGRQSAYTRSIRDLIGHGEGVFGIVDAYPAETPGATPSRLRAIERRLLDWRWRLRSRTGRLTRIHGDFHPFNILFPDPGRAEDVRPAPAGGDAGADASGQAADQDRPTLLDASRGCQGDPADDVTCLAVNYPFFALAAAHEDPGGAWRGGLRALWRGFLDAYEEGSHDTALFEVAAPFLAWRCLVLACPPFYPSLPMAARDALLGFAERVLDAPRFDPEMIEELFA